MTNDSLKLTLKITTKLRMMAMLITTKTKMTKVIVTWRKMMIFKDNSLWSDII